MLINQSEKVLSSAYNTNVRNLLRNPRLDMLISEYPGDMFEQDGMFYSGSDTVVLENSTEIETILTRDVFPIQPSWCERAITSYSPRRAN